MRSAKVCLPAQVQICVPHHVARYVRGRFLAYWQAHGGLALNGYPLSAELAQTLEDGQSHIVQYFERTRLEYHPRNAAPYDILLGQFGRRIVATVPDAPVAPVSAEAGMIFFPETVHNVGSRFAAYWTANGGLAQFGYPLSEPFAQQLEDGKTYTVQYFERARVELHPENGAPYDILLGQFGRRILVGEATCQRCREERQVAAVRPHATLARWNRTVNTSNTGSSTATASRPPGTPRLATGW